MTEHWPRTTNGCDPAARRGWVCVALMRGRPRTATRFFRITVASLNELDGQYLCYNLSFLARGAALAGFVEEARQSLPAALNSPRFPMCEADWMIAEAAILAAEGTLEAASEQALRAARQAASLGEWAIVGIGSRCRPLQRGSGGGSTCRNGSRAG